MMGKSVCPSCQKQGELLEHICTSEIYRGITLMSASIVDIYIYIYIYIVYEVCLLKVCHFYFLFFREDISVTNNVNDEQRWWPRFGVASVKFTVKQ